MPSRYRSAGIFVLSGWLDGQPAERNGESVALCPRRGRPAEDIAPENAQPPKNRRYRLRYRSRRWSAGVDA